MKRHWMRLFVSVAVVAAVFTFGMVSVYAVQTPTAPVTPEAPLLPNVSINIGDPTNATGTASTLQLLFLITILTLLPTILLMMTSFTRIIIAMHFLRSALGTQQMPPNQIMIGLALFLTFFLMSPVITEVNDKAFQPYSRGEITQSQAIDIGMEPIRGFMLRQVKTSDMALFTKITGVSYAEKEDAPNTVLIPAFLLGEITKGFSFGFYIYIPFIIIDMVVASVLMAMGMMMLPPAMISLPFKVLLFVMVDGWNLTVKMLLQTFR